ncbi:Rap1a/Tai family immunity protein [Dyella sp. SG609]|uniref:Rap1a/Tai family immunity protein n=1 Tax=Dyella sp. SG609 TaxID=2587018 RepID=UPI001447B8CF|nr:Rap1a/Tai family immunity protein [Dyella sp. SG609]NKJ21986.1 hypothetical protein [Dyella sp. SG609]
MKTLIFFVLMAASMTCVGQEKAQSADIVYTNLKRFVDFTEGHPPTPDAVQDVSMSMSVGYMLGLLDGLTVGAVVRPHNNTDCLKDRISTIMLARNFIAYVDAHPSKRGSEYQGVAMHSIVNAYPCLAPLGK